MTSLVSRESIAWAFGLEAALNHTSDKELDKMRDLLGRYEPRGIRKAFERGLMEGRDLLGRRIGEIRIREWVRCRCPCCQRVRILPMVKTDVCPLCAVQMNEIARGDGSDEKAIVLTFPTFRRGE